MPNPTSKLNLVINGVTTQLDIHDANAVPRSGGVVMTGSYLGRTTNDSEFVISGGQTYDDGAFLALKGKFASAQTGIAILAVNDGSDYRDMRWYPGGTWTWTGTAVQLVSDQRLKQQIAEIDDKLLDF